MHCCRVVLMPDGYVCMCPAQASCCLEFEIHFCSCPGMHKSQYSAGYLGLEFSQIVAPINILNIKCFVDIFMHTMTNGFKCSHILSSPSGAHEQMKIHPSSHTPPSRFTWMYICERRKRKTQACGGRRKRPILASAADNSKRWAQYIHVRPCVYSGVITGFTSVSWLWVCI